MVNIISKLRRLLLNPELALISQVFSLARSDKTDWPFPPVTFHVGRQQPFRSIWTFSPLANVRTPRSTQRDSNHAICFREAESMISALVPHQPFRRNV